MLGRGGYKKNLKKGRPVNCKNYGLVFLYTTRWEYSYLENNQWCEEGILLPNCFVSFINSFKGFATSADELALILN